MKREFIIFDTEYTTWEGCINNGWNDWQKKEVVQIAAIKVSFDNLEVIDELNIYVKPVINPILSDYFIKLTKITNETVQEQGVPFEQAYIMFKDFVNDLDCYSFNWSGDRSNLSDGEVMNENLSLIGMIDKKTPVYKNISPWFKDMYKKSDMFVEKQNSGAIAKFLGVINEIEELGLDEHNAMYDVYSILSGIRYFKPENID